MIDTLLFDLDNTLLDREYAIRKTFEQLVAMDHNPEALDDLLKWDNYGYTPKPEIYRQYTNKYQTTLQDEQTFHQFIVDHQHKHATPFPGVIEALQTLAKTYTLGIITNGNEHGQRNKIKQALGDNAKLFKVCIVSGDKNIHKPDARIFMEALDALDKKAQDVAYIGDNIAADVEGSKGVGITPVWINAYTIPGNPDCLHIKHIHELINHSF